MGLLDHFKSLKTPEIRLAWIVAIAADTIQIAALPLFAEGAISPADTVLDLVVGGIGHFCRHSPPNCYPDLICSPHGPRRCGTSAAN
jgi:hypothetical protein